jgi:predicted DNA-binding transcriptional regulator AlpA
MDTTLSPLAPEDDRLLRDHEVAALLGVSRREVWRLKIRSCKVSPRARRWPLSEVRLFIALRLEGKTAA